MATLSYSGLDPTDVLIFINRLVSVLSDPEVFFTEFVDDDDILTQHQLVRSNPESLEVSVWFKDTTAPSHSPDAYETYTVTELTRIGYGHETIIRLDMEEADTKIDPTPSPDGEHEGVPTTARTFLCVVRGGNLTSSRIDDETFAMYNETGRRMTRTRPSFYVRSRNPPRVSSASVCKFSKILDELPDRWKIRPTKIRAVENFWELNLDVNEFCWVTIRLFVESET